MNWWKRRKISSKLAGFLILFTVLWIGGTLCAASSLTANIPLLADLRTSLIANYASDFLNDTLTSLRLTFLGDTSTSVGSDAHDIAFDQPAPAISLPDPQSTATPSTDDVIEKPTSTATSSPTQSPISEATSTLTITPTTQPYDTPTSIPTELPTSTYTPTVPASTDPPPTPQDTPIPQFADIIYEETKAGSSKYSTSITTFGSLTAVDNHLYLAAITTKSGHVHVTGVSGLGLSWTILEAQCSGRHQTRVEIWIGQGSPSSDGSVTATLSEAPKNAIIAVSRYSGVDPHNPVGTVTSANTNGVNGSCHDGSDNDAYSLNLPVSTDGVMAFAAIAHRHKDHFPGNGFVERIEEHKGSDGDVAGLSLVDREVDPTGVKVRGAFSCDVDWAVIAVELLPAH